MLNKVKIYLRISHSALDGDLTDTINACLQDLKIYGVRTADEDPLILNAVKLYCKAEYTDDPVKAAAYRQRYDALKACLGVAGEYKEAAADE
jgi:hypothetical protein